MDTNVTVLIGRMTKEANMIHGEKTVAKFSLAVNRMKKGEVDFINCTAFGKTAEVVEKYTSKGSRVAVNGRIQTGSYEKDGRKIYTTDVIVESLQLLDSKSDEPPKSDSEFMTVDDSQVSLPF